MSSILDTINKGTQYLQQKGVESPRLNMELLMSHILELPRMQLYMAFDRLVTESELAELRVIIRKRGERYPLQYLVGEVEFLGRSFLCDNRALIPRPETEELVQYCMELDLRSEARVLDLCCGSGVIGLSIKGAAKNEVVVDLVDYSSDALALAQENAARMGGGVEFYLSNLYESIPEGQYDLIVSNPPYVSTRESLDEELTYEPKMALFAGEEGLDIVRRIITDSTSYLRQGGVLAMEIGYNQSDAVILLLEKAGYSSIICHCDLDKIPRFMIAHIDATC